MTYHIPMKGKAYTFSFKEDTDRKTLCSRALWEIVYKLHANTGSIEKEGGHGPHNFHYHKLKAHQVCVHFIWPPYIT